MAKPKRPEFKQGIFRPQNPAKCLNKSEIVYRSWLEFRLMRTCDRNPNVVQWGSENVVIPYENPLKQGAVSRYFMDFMIRMVEEGKTVTYLVEIKPDKQTKPPKPSKRKKTSTILYENAMWAQNQAKWKAAEAFSRKKGYVFKILTEKHLDQMEDPTRWR